MSFLEFGLSGELTRAIAEQGYTEPTPIQKTAIPAVLSGGDLMACAQTGTGKTAGFVLPILQRLSDRPYKKPGKRPVRALILTPTRELAAQVEESVRHYGRHCKVRSMVMFGGVKIRPQISKLRDGVDVVVATPGRLLDHAQQRTIDLSHVETLVLDEADRMLDMGFIHDIRKILGLLPKQRQNLLFSATFSKDVRRLAGTFLDKPVLIEAPRKQLTADRVEQKVYHVDRGRKRQLLAHLISEGAWYQVLVFTRTKHMANRLADQLGKDGIPSMAIHGSKSQGSRTRALAQFKAGKIQALVATDIAARGIDINELPHVVNYELPNVAEDYVHRIGRTGRAGTEGEAVSLVCIDEKKLMADIERLIKRRIPADVVEGFEPDPNAKPKPIQNGRNQAGGQRRGSGSAPRKGKRKPPARGAGRKSPGSPRNSNSARRRKKTGRRKPAAARA